METWSTTSGMGQISPSKDFSKFRKRQDWRYMNKTFCCSWGGQIWKSFHLFFSLKSKIVICQASFFFMNPRACTKTLRPLTCSLALPARLSGQLSRDDSRSARAAWALQLFTESLSHGPHAAYTTTWPNGFIIEVEKSRAVEIPQTSLNCSGLEHLMYP